MMMGPTSRVRLEPGLVESKGRFQFQLEATQANGASPIQHARRSPIQHTHLECHFVLQQVRVVEHAGGL